RCLGAYLPRGHRSDYGGSTRGGGFDRYLSALRGRGGLGRAGIETAVGGGDRRDSDGDAAAGAAKDGSAAVICHGCAKGTQSHGNGPNAPNGVAAPAVAVS